MKAYVFLANGFEEMEATYPISILRFVGIEVVVVSVEAEKCVIGSHGIKINADVLFYGNSFTDADIIIIIIPGGQPGTERLNSFEPLKTIITYYAENKSIAAICAAPSILGKMNLLQGRNATCYPGYEDELNGAIISKSKVVTDGNIITAAGPGVAKEFSLEIVKRLGDDNAYAKAFQKYK